MAGHEIGMTEEKIARWIKEGRGQGEGRNYRPWFEIQDVPSSGRESRVGGWKTGRTHHLLSKLEASYFRVLDLSPAVLDIREQYPLLPREETIAIAERLGIAHPRFGDVYLVLTSDVLISARIGLADKRFARTVKMSSELPSDRVMEIFEIERIYWETRGVDWGIVTERDLPPGLRANAEWLHDYLPITDHVALDESQFLDIARLLTEQVIRGDSPLNQATWQCDKRLGLKLGDCLAIAYHLIATNRWQIDLRTRIDPSSKLTLLRVEETLL